MADTEKNQPVDALPPSRHKARDFEGWADVYADHEVQNIVRAAVEADRAQRSETVTLNGRTHTAAEVKQRILDLDAENAALHEQHERGAQHIAKLETALVDRARQTQKWQTRASAEREANVLLKAEISILEAENAHFRDRAQQGEPVAWIRFRSDGGYEGPIMHAAMEDVRKKSGAWTPLFAATKAAAPADATRQQEMVVRVAPAPAGYKLVPIKPTPEMSTAGKHTLKGAVDMYERAQAECVYASMIVAAPDAPTIEHIAGHYGETLDERAENALLWCYRRLKNSYGRLPFVEEAIAALHERTSRAQRTTIDNENCRTAPVPDTGIPTSDYEYLKLRTRGLVYAASAVIERWESPKWKDEAPTADYIARLREAVNLASSNCRAPVSGTPTSGAVEDDNLGAAIKSLHADVCKAVAPASPEMALKLYAHIVVDPAHLSELFIAAGLFDAAPLPSEAKADCPRCPIQTPYGTATCYECAEKDEAGAAPAHPGDKEEGREHA